MKKLISFLTTFIIILCFCLTGCGTDNNGSTEDGGNTPSVYTITYDLDGGSVETENPTTFTSDTETFTITNPTKADCVFRGWKIVGEASGYLKTFTVTKGTTCNFSLKAYYYDDKHLSGETINITPTKYETYLSLTDTSEIAKYLYNNSNITDTDAKGVNISWVNIDKTTTINIQLATDEAFNNIAYTKTVTYTDTVSVRGNIDIYNLYPNTLYYYKVIDGNDKVLKNDSFKTDGTYRFINVAGVYNFRDIGGKVGTDGKTIPYGLVYRCGKLDDITTEGFKTFTEDLKIKTEIDVRMDSTYTSSKLPKNEIVKFVQAGIVQWDYLMPTSTSTYEEGRSYSPLAVAGLKTGLLEFTNKANYPIVFHCSAGADRTGTFAFILEGLLGVSYEDMAKDFELTSFSQYGKRWRSSINVSGSVYSFDESGFMQDDANNLVAFDRVYNYILTNYGEGQGFTHAVEKYLIKVVGLTEQNIADIKANLLK